MAAKKKKGVAKQKKPVAKKKAAAKKKPAAKKKVASRTTAAKHPKRDLDKLDKRTVNGIDRTAKYVFTKIQSLGKPLLKFPVRSLSNVRYDKRRGFFELGRGRKERTLTVNTVKNFAQTLKLMALSKEMVLTDDFATKREAYYVSKNWGDCKFKEQPESDTCMDDIEALFSLDGLAREQLRFYPEDHGGSVVGPLVVSETSEETGREIKTNCRSEGSMTFTIPHSVEGLRFSTKAKFILAIETGGMFKRLHSQKFWRDYNCILVEMGGVPTRATRRFVRKLADDCKLRVYAFVDCDPYGISNIYRTLKVGSGNAAHLSQFFCVPQAQFLGVTPQDIIDFDLEGATHKLSDVDIKRAKDALKNDPFFQAQKKWQKAIEMMLQMGVRAEQQALAKHGLNFVVEEYLPRKLKAPNLFLP